MKGIHYSDAPTKFMLPEHMAELIGLNSVEVCEFLLKTPRVHKEIEKKLLDRIGTVPEFGAGTADILETIFNASRGQIHDLARIVVILSQSKGLLLTTKGANLAAAAAFLGDNSILLFIKRERPPSMIALPPLSDMTEDALNTYVERAERILCGLLPESCQIRQMSMHAMGAMPLPVTLKDIFSRQVMIKLVRLAIEYAAERECQDEAHQST